MTIARAYVSPPHVTITIASIDRYDVSQALLDAVLMMEREAATKRRGSPGQRRTIERADRLREIYKQVVP